VEAIQYTPTSAAEVRRTLTGWNTVWWAGANEELRIATPQGSKPCWYGDWIVRGVVGNVQAKCVDLEAVHVYAGDQVAIGRTGHTRHSG